MNGYRIGCFLFLLAACAAPGALQAQPLKKASQAGVKAAFNYAPYSASVAMRHGVKNAYVVDLEKYLGQFHEKAFRARFASRLPASHYGELAAQEERARLVQYVKYIQQHNFVHSRRNLISARIDSRVMKGKVPYIWYIPPRARLIMVGETHKEAALQTEFVALVRQYRQEYPNRRVYVASEFLPDLFVGQPFDKKMLIKDFSQLADAETVLVGYKNSLKPLLNEGVTFLGLEPYSALYSMARRAGTTEVSEAELDELATSITGVRLRNAYWATRIEELRAYDPQGVVFVYAGMGHVGYHEAFSLSLMLREQQPFVIQLNVPEGLYNTNPLYVYFREDPNTRAAFNAEADHKLLETWTPYSPRSYKDAMGCDLTVLLHSSTWKPTPLAEGVTLNAQDVQGLQDLSSFLSR